MVRRLTTSFELGELILGIEVFAGLFAQISVFESWRKAFTPQGSWVVICPYRSDIWFRYPILLITANGSRVQVDTWFFLLPFLFHVETTALSTALHRPSWASEPSSINDPQIAYTSATYNLYLFQFSWIQHSTFSIFLFAWRL